MSRDRSSLKPVAGANRSLRQRLGLRGEFALALLPTLTVLGVFAESTYEQGDFTISTGDRLILYTDGITEGRNPAGDEFGDDRLADSASRHRGLPAEDMLAAMLRDIEGFNGGVYEDDATLIVAAV